MPFIEKHKDYQGLEEYIGRLVEFEEQNPDFLKQESGFSSLQSDES